MDYIKAPKAYDKLKRAEKDFRPVYISAVAGWGKSAAVEYYYKNKPVLVLSGDNGTLSDMPDIDTIRRGTVIIDDISWLTDVSSRDYVIKLLACGGKHVILIGRASFPQWMSEFMLQYDFLRIGEKDLQFGIDEIAEYMKQKALTLTDEDLAEVLKKTHGYPPMVAMYSEHIEAGETIDKRMYTAVSRNLADYFDRIFFGRWENDVQQMLLALCQYSEFTLPMAEMLAGSKDTYRNLRYCYHVGSFLIKIDDNTWTFREHFTDFLKWKQHALWYYHKAGMKEQVKNLLIQNARKHPGKGSYYQLRKYYMELPEDIIGQNPVLMCGMSMLYSIMFRPEESEKWYQILQEYGNSPYRTADERKEVKTRLAYLDIGLPHRAAKGLIGILRRSAKLSRNHEINLPEFSVTGNMPSLMNGGLDYCDWSLIDDKLARFMAGSLETILKNASKGLVNIALAESGFERATMESYEPAVDGECMELCR